MHPAAMQPTQANKKSKEILAAIAAGNTCEEVLARDPSLTYHDIFHAVAEAPTSHWRKSSGCARVTHAARTPAKQRSD
jgi:hypothetical protein